MQDDGISALLLAPGKSGVPGVVGTRCLSDNLSDLKAQVAANAKGISLVAALIEEYSLPVVQAYMNHIQANAEASVRKMLVDFSLSAVRLLYARHITLCNHATVAGGALVVKQKSCRCKLHSGGALVLGRP